MKHRFPCLAHWLYILLCPVCLVSGVRAQPPATQATTAPTSATQPSTQPAEKITLNFKDAPLDAVLDHLSEAAGLVIVKDGPVDGRVTVLSKQPISSNEAVALLNAVLKNNGFTAITSGRTLTITSRDKAKKGGIPVQFGADPEAIEATPKLVTQVVPLRNLDAVKLKADLQPLLSTDADVTATAGSNAIIITDASVNIRRVVQIIAGLDTQQSILSDIRIIQLKHANATAAAKLITSVFKGDAGPMPGQPGMPPQQPGQPAAGGAHEGPIPGGGVDQALRGAKVNAAADERTNTLVIAGPVETLKVIDNLLKQLDVEPSNALSEIRAFPLRYAVAESTAKLIESVFKSEDKDNQNSRYGYFFGPMMNQGQDSGQQVKINVAFDERTNTVIVTAPPPTLKMIEGLLKDLDANPAVTAELKVFQLKHADAFLVSTLIEDTFNPKSADADNSIIRYFYYEGQTPAKKGPKITAVSDDRTNSVIVTAPKELLKTVEELIDKLDSNPVSEETLFIYRLKNGQADNLELVLNTLFGNISQPQQQQQGQNGNQPFNGDQQQQQQNSGSGRSSRSRSSRNGNNDRASNRRGGTRNSRGRNGNNMPQLSPGLTRAVTELSGEVFVVADLDTNALLVTTAAKYEHLVRQIIDELDRPVPQVLIKVLVAEVTHDNSSDLGVDFSILNSRPGGFGQSYGTQFGAPTNPSGLVVRLVEPDITATLHALAQAGKLEVLSRPYVLASDNQLARITVGQQVPFITNSRVTDLGQTINTVEYDDIGIILYVTPHINPDGLVILDVAPEISSLSANSIPISNEVSVPIINTRSAESRVGVKTGNTIVIGGLMEDQKRSSVDKVPILGDIPLLNLIFSRQRVTKTKTELLIFLEPHVAQEPESLRPMSEQEMKGTTLTPKAISPGTFNEHLEGLHRGDVPQTQPARSSTSVFRPGGQGELPNADERPPATRPDR